MRKSFSAIPSPLVTGTAKGPYRRQVLSVDNSSFSQSDGARKSFLVPESPIADTPVQSDEEETELGKKRKSDEFLEHSVEGKRKFSMEESSGGKSSNQFTKFKSLRVNDLGEKLYL